MADGILGGLCLQVGRARTMDLQGDSPSCPFPIILGMNGGIGFQLLGGVIKVDASSGAEVDISFDRPMVFNGDVRAAPGGAGWYINGTPLLINGARALAIPISGQGQPPTLEPGSATTDAPPLPPPGYANRN